MRKIVLILLSFLAFLNATAQTPKRTIQGDSLLKEIVAALPSDTIAVPVIDKPLFFNQNLVFKLRLDFYSKDCTA